MKFDSIILDVDGTIWDTTEIVANAWNEAIKKYFPQVASVNAQILKGQFGKTMEVIANNLFPSLSDSDKKILIDKCCEEEQVALSENKKNITYKNVIETISVLSKKYPIYIVSNCQSGYIELVIEKNKIEKYVSDFECYGNTLKNKAENILLLKERNNLKNPVYVGDTQGDADACKEAKIPFIWAEYGFGNVETSFYIAKIKDFSNLLQIL